MDTIRLLSSFSSLRFSALSWEDLGASSLSGLSPSEDREGQRDSQGERQTSFSVPHPAAPKLGRQPRSH